MVNSWSAAPQDIDKGIVDWKPTADHASLHGKLILRLPICSTFLYPLPPSGSTGLDMQTSAPECGHARVIKHPFPSTIPPVELEMLDIASIDMSVFSISWCFLIECFFVSAV